MNLDNNHKYMYYTLLAFNFGNFGFCWKYHFKLQLGLHFLIGLSQNVAFYLKCFGFENARSIQMSMITQSHTINYNPLWNCPLIVVGSHHFDPFAKLQLRVRKVSNMSDLLLSIQIP